MVNGLYFSLFSGVFVLFRCVREFVGRKYGASIFKPNCNIGGKFVHSQMLNTLSKLESPVQINTKNMLQVFFLVQINTKNICYKFFCFFYKTSVSTLERRAERTMPSRLAFVCRNRRQRSSQASGNFVGVACSLAAVCRRDI